MDDKQRQKNFEKSIKLTKEQRDLCRFITITYADIKKVNGKYTYLGTEKAKGLQVKNRVYFMDGKYKLVNSKSVRIKDIFEGVPDWANDELISRYNNYYVH